MLLFLAKLAAKHSVTEVIVEANFGDGMYTKLLTPILNQYHACSVEEVKHNIQKEKRMIDTLEPVMTSHRLIFNEEVIASDMKQANQDVKYSLFYQLTRLTRERGALAHDDRVDALSIAVAHWGEVMARDNKKANEQYESREGKRLLKAITGSIFKQKTGKWKGTVMGKKTRAKTWANGGR